MNNINFIFPSVPITFPTIAKDEPQKKIFYIPSISYDLQNKMELISTFNDLKLDIDEIEKKLEISNTIIDDLEGDKLAAKLPLLATLIKTFYKWYNQSSINFERMHNYNLIKIENSYTHNIEILKNKIERINDNEKMSLNALMEAIDLDDYEAINYFALSDPENFKMLMLKQDGYGNTPLFKLVYNEQIEILNLMAKAAPKEFKTALTISNNFDCNCTPLNGILHNIEMLKTMAEEAPDSFREMVLTEDNQGTPLTVALRTNNIEALMLMAEKAPKEFKIALLKKKEYGTVVSLAILKNKKEALKLFSLVANKEYSLALKIKNNNGLVPFDKATIDLEVMEFLFDSALEDCQSWMVNSDENGQTPVYKAALRKNLPLLKLMAEKAPKEFKAALLKQDAAGNTPLQVSACSSHFDMEVTKFLIEESPLEALNAMNKQGDTIFNFLKQFRPKNYKEITKLLKTNVSLKQLNKVQVNRIGLGHVFDISGNTQLIKTDTREIVATINLTGHQPYEWFHFAKKYFSELLGLYPQMLSENQKILLDEIFEWGSNGMAYSAEEKLERIKAGLPTPLIAGFSKHSVVLLVWGDHFILCNRGGGTRKPIDIFHFDPSQLDVKIVKKIEQIKIHGSLEEYIKLFFKDLPKELQFKKTILDMYMEKSVRLPMQTVDNCSFVSMATAVFAFLLVGNVREVNSRDSNPGKTLVDEPLKAKQPPLQAIMTYFKEYFLNMIGNLQLGSSSELSVYDDSMARAKASYQTWLTHLQLSFLERNICPSKEGSPFEPDSNLVEEALRKAHLMPFDSICKNKLEELASIYKQSKNYSNY
ncbi:MAG: hypothetical protein H0V82_00550 [Candidatus Protochlamydia sp.]|nr:hypothetical protein [Candidatus Protochlamydia sp.]